MAEEPDWEALRREMAHTGPKEGQTTFPPGQVFTQPERRPRKRRTRGPIYGQRGAARKTGPESRLLPDPREMQDPAAAGPEPLDPSEVLRVGPSGSFMQDQRETESFRTPHPGSELSAPEEEEIIVPLMDDEKNIPAEVQKTCSPKGKTAPLTKAFTDERSGPCDFDQILEDVNFPCPQPSEP